MTDNTDNDETVSGSLESQDKSQTLPDGVFVSLEITDGPDKGEKRELSATRTVIGRKAADIVLSDPTVSGRHAILDFEGGKLFITDNNSTNGTRINGEQVESGRVNNLDEIQVGDTKILVSLVEDKYAAFMPDPDDPESTDSRVISSEEEDEDVTVIRKALDNPEVQKNIHLVLEVFDGPDKGKKFQAIKRSTVIGRSSEADLQIADKTISKKHCQLEVHNKDKMTLKDLASSNGTRLNERYVSAVIVRTGDVIQIGETKIKILIHIKP